MTIGGGIAALYFAALLNGVQRAALIELGSALLLFIGLSLFISRRLSRSWVIVVSLLSTGAIVAAFNVIDDYWQSIFLEIGSGAALFVVLDLFLHRLFTKAISHAKDMAEPLSFDHMAEDYYRILAEARGWNDIRSTTDESL